MEAKAPALFTKTVKAGKTTFFFDVREARNKNKYLSITSSYPNPESKNEKDKFKKTTMVLFSDDIGQFVEALTDSVGRMK
ncbi:MAG: DUF3276 family protein [Ignavibacteriales bacterium]|nr:DUF3276 family protein [Ignavibacteriales bacterium]